MKYIGRYMSPLGAVLLATDETGLTGLWFEGQKYCARGLDPAAEERETPVFTQTRAWLDAYFAGKRPETPPPLHFTGSSFQNAVWTALTAIPYGTTTTYGALAAHLSGGKAAARAVGGAVGHNPISIIVPCHRVVGAQGQLTGYAGGLERKRALLRLEGILNK